MMRKSLSVVATVTLLGFVGAPYAAADPPQKVKDKKEQKEEQKLEKKEQKDKEKGDKKERGPKAKKEHHNNGRALLGDKIKTNGHHELGKKGNYTASAEVRGGKIAGVHVKHATKGDVHVTKYKTNKKMAMLRTEPVLVASLEPVELQEYVGTIWIGYSYIDEYGEEEIYWFPVDMILDGETGAIEYEPAY